MTQDMVQENGTDASDGIKILFGVYGLDEDNVKELVRTLKGKNVAIQEYGCKHRKIGVIEYLQEHPETEIVVLSQCLESASPYTKRDFQLLCERYDKVRFIPLLVDDARGGAIVTDLYHLGIFDGIFQSDADMDTLAKIINMGRSRKETKVYYDVNEEIEEMNKANIASCRTYIETSSEEELLNHTLHVLQMCTPIEFRNVLGTLPADTLKKIAAFDHEDLVPFFVKKRSEPIQVTEQDSSKRKTSRFAFADGIKNVFREKSISAMAMSMVEKIGAAVDTHMGRETLLVTDEADEQDERSGKSDSEYLSTILSKELIGFAGTGRKVGVSTQVISCAYYLHNHGYKVAVFDATGSKTTTFNALKAMDDSQMTDDGVLHYCGVDYFRVGKIGQINVILSSIADDVYNFILLDYGLAEEPVLSDMGRCGMRFIVANASALERGAFLSFLSQHREVRGNYRYMVRGIAPENWEKQGWLHKEISRALLVENCVSPFDGRLSESVQAVLSKYVEPGETKKECLQDTPETCKPEKIIVGTETIFVTSLRHGTGKTHLSIALANYLSAYGRTAFVTRQQEMVRSLINSKVDVYFGDMDLNSVQNTKFLILDYGDIEELAGYELDAFDCANKKVFMCWANDDYLTDLANYLSGVSADTSNWYFVFNNVSSSKMREVRRVMSSYNQCYLPVFDADELTKEVKKIMSAIS